MDRDQKDLGIVIGQLRYLTPRIEKMEKNIDLLLEFKWKLIGMAMIGAFVATTVVEIVRH